MGRDAPLAAKDVHGLGEDVVVEESSVDGEHAHKEDDVATSEEHGEDLTQHNNITLSHHTYAITSDSTISAVLFSSYFVPTDQLRMKHVSFYC